MDTNTGRAMKNTLLQTIGKGVSLVISHPVLQSYSPFIFLTSVKDIIIQRIKSTVLVLHTVKKYILVKFLLIL